MNIAQFNLMLFFLFALSVIGQEKQPSEIKMEKVFGGYDFYCQGKKINTNQLVKILESHKQAYEQIKSAQKNHQLATISSGIGGFVIGWQTGRAISGKSVKWEMIAVGVGVTVISFPLMKNSFKKARNAVDLYNVSLEKSLSYSKKRHTQIIVYSSDRLPTIKISIPIY